ncbi:MAG: hypothetical protein ACOCYT_03245 [Chloroflexota bacterium]
MTFALKRAWRDNVHFDLDLVIVGDTTDMLVVMDFADLRSPSLRVMDRLRLYTEVFTARRGD